MVLLHNVIDNVHYFYSFWKCLKIKRKVLKRKLKIKKMKKLPFLLYKCTTNVLKKIKKFWIF